MYDGERGRFRGFIAAQEGWLTDGESGITGQSIAVIFEFPKEERRRVTRTKRIRVGSGPVDTDTCPDPHSQEAGNPPPGNLICSGWGTASGLIANPETTAIGLAEVNWANAQDSGSRAWNSAWTLSWQSFPGTDYWQTRAEAAAIRVCRVRGAKYVAGSADFGPGHSDFSSSGLNRGDGLGWFYVDIQENAYFNYQARQSRSWTATCKKKVRRTRK